MAREAEEDDVKEDDDLEEAEEADDFPAFDDEDDALIVTICLPLLPLSPGLISLACCCLLASSNLAILSRVCEKVSLVA